MIEALVPPNPKLLDKAASIRRFWAVLATRSITLCRVGCSRFNVGGATPSRIARIENTASIAPAAPSRWPVADFVDDMAKPREGLTE